MGGIAYRKPATIRGFERRIKFDTTGFLTGITLGVMPAGAFPVSVRLVKMAHFSDTTYCQMIYKFWIVKLSGRGMSTLMRQQAQCGPKVMTGTLPKFIECFDWADNITTLPLAADRSLIFRGGHTSPSPPTAGDMLVQITYLYDNHGHTNPRIQRNHRADDHS